MGVWGMGPFDSDDAGDMVAGLSDKITRVVMAKTDARARDYYNEARAVVQIVLLTHGTDILGGGGLDALFKALIRMRSDTEWLAGWKQPKLIARRIEKEISLVFDRMRTCKYCRDAYYSTKQDQIELKRVVMAAVSVKVPAAHRRKPLPKRTSKARRFRVPKKRVPR